MLFFLRVVICLFIGGWRHAVLGAEVAGKGVGVGKSAGLTYLFNVQVGLAVHQTYSIIEAQFANVGWQRNTIATLCKGGTNAFLRQACTIDERLSAKVGLQEQFFVFNQIAQAEE